MSVTSMRAAYGDALIALGGTDPRIVALSAEVSNSDYSAGFAAAYPDRFYNVGIAEQALVDVAVGMSLGGWVPFASTFAFLFATRAAEMIRTHLCYGGANVKLAGAYAGLSDSFDGPTHHSITDLAILRSLPNLNVVVPADAGATHALMRIAAATDGPFYLRLCRNEVEDLFRPPGIEEFRVGGSQLLRVGSDVTILACGVAVARALAAAEILGHAGVAARVVDVYSVKPLDFERVVGCAHDTGAIVTVEEHSVVGGLGGAVAEAVGEEAPVPVVRCGIPDRFAETGPYAALLDRYGLSVEEITRAVRKAMALRDGTPAGTEHVAS